MPDEWGSNRAIRGQIPIRERERAVTALAAAQHGVVSARQLGALGLSADAIWRRLAAGRLHGLHPAVYAVGRPGVPREGRWLAAVLACGEGAVLSHRSAAALWDVRPTDPARTDVTAPGDAGRTLEGIARHRGAVAAEEMTVLRGIPVTTLARTLLDLAAVVPPRALERALEQALVLRLYDDAAVAAVLSRHPRRRGRRALRAALDGIAQGPLLTRSELEERFLALVRSTNLPRPEVNAQAWAGERLFEVDFLWRDRRVVVEVDGYATHGTRAAFERDREKDAHLQTAGYTVARFTHRQVTLQPDSARRTLTALIR